MAKKTGKGAVGVPIASGGSNINKPLKGKSGLAARTAHEVGLAHGKR